MLFLLALKLNLKAFSCVKTESNPNFAAYIGKLSNIGKMNFSVYLKKDYSNILYSLLIYWNGMRKT